MKNHGRFVLVWVLLFLVTTILAPRSSFAQDKKQDGDAAPAAENASEPQTTANPDIPLDQLELLLQPLTKEELVVEAVAWRDLLKQKVAQISSAEIAVKRQNQQMEEAEEKSEEGEKKAAEAAKEVEKVQKKVDELDEKAAQAVPGNESRVAAAANKVSSEADTAKAKADVIKAEAEQDAEAAEEQKAAILDDLPTLRDEKTDLIDRLGVTLTELEAKGGDVEEFRTYVAAVSGINIDTADASASWTAITGWLTSDQGGKRWGLNILKFLGILLAAYVVSKILAWIVYRATSAWGRSSTLLRDFLYRFVQQAVMVIGFLAALATLEINVAPLLAAIGAAGLVIGLALQDTLGNFAAGLLMLAYRPFDVGHVIEAGGIMGKVESMNMVSTHIKTFDNRHVIVPNSQIWGGTITNASVSDIRRVDLTFGVGYNDDIARAQEILERLVHEHPKVLDDPEPMVKLNELGESSINFICWPWCKASDYGDVKWGLLRAVKDEFENNGISIPFPQRDIHVYQESRNSTEAIS